MGSHSCERPNREMIHIENVSFSYGKRLVLENLSFSVPSTGITWLTGKNGVGKTTLLRTLGGVLDSSYAVTPQETAMVYWDADCLTFDYLTVEEMLDFMESLHGNPASATYADSLIFPQMRGNTVRALSLGQKARLIFVLAQMTPADIILLDEPFNGLDHDGRVLATEVIEQMSSTRHVIFSAHEEGPWNNLDAARLQLIDPFTISYNI